MLGVPRAHVATLAGAALALFVACLLTAARVPLFDPDEGYYPATAAESLRSGVSWDLRFNGEPRWEKPVLSYAAIQLAFGAFGESTAAARLPSALLGAALVLVVGLLVGQLAGSRAGALSAAVIASTLGVQIFARAAHPEIAVVLAIAATELLICLWLARPAWRSSPWLALSLGVAIGGGVLAKGPVAIALPTLMLMSALPWLPRPWPALRSLIGPLAIAALTAAVIVVPWYAAMTAQHGLEFLRTAVWSQNVTRYTSGTFGHRASVAFFIAPALIGLLPWTGLLPAAFASIRGREWTPRQLLRVCMAASAISAFVFYSLSVSKLANYALAFFPPLAVLIGLYLDEELDRRPRPTATRVGAVILALCAVALMASPLLIGRAFDARELLGGVPDRNEAFIPSMLWPAVIPAGAALLIAAAVVATAKTPARIAALAVVGVAVPLSLLYGIAPAMDHLYPWHDFGQAIRAEPARTWMLEYRAPSLSFYSAHVIEPLVDTDALQAMLASNDDGWLVMERRAYEEACTAGLFTNRETRIARTGGRMVLVRLTPDRHGEAGRACRTGKR